MNPAVLRAYRKYALEELHLESARKGSLVELSSPLSHSTSPPPTPLPDACSALLSACLTLYVWKFSRRRVQEPSRLEQPHGIRVICVGLGGMYGQRSSVPELLRDTWKLWVGRWLTAMGLRHSSVECVKLATCRGAKGFDLRHTPPRRVKLATCRGLAVFGLRHTLSSRGALKCTHRGFVFMEEIARVPTANRLIPCTWYL